MFKGSRAAAIATGRAVICAKSASVNTRPVHGATAKPKRMSGPCEAAFCEGAKAVTAATTATA